MPDDDDLQWPDSDSMDSDDARSAGSADSADLLSPWLGSLSAGPASAVASASSSTVGFGHTGHLSPISNGMEMPYGGGAARSSAHLESPSQSPSALLHQSHSQSTPSPLSPARPHSQFLGLEHHPRRRHVALLPRAPEGRGIHQHHQIAWDEGSDDGLMAPKLEPVDDDDFCMEDLQEAPSPPPALALLSQPLGGAPEQQPPKRPRGRPRKHPLLPTLTPHKITKGRSKTGCLTCRKRKKKCDEAKPRCKPD